MMKTTFMLLAVVALTGLAVSASAGGGCCAVRPLESVAGGTAVDTPQGKPQTICPVMKAPVNKGVFADHQGKRVYFCCGSCKSTFLADPDKYVKEMESSGVQLEKVPSEPQPAP